MCNRDPIFTFLTVLLVLSQLFLMPIGQVKADDHLSRAVKQIDSSQSLICFEPSYRSSANDTAKEFIARNLNYQLALSASQAQFQLADNSLTLQFHGTMADALLLGIDPRDVAQFGKVVSHNIYQNIDLIYYGNRAQLEFDLIVAPGADPDQIAFNFTGAGTVKIAENGDLILGLPAGELRQHRPVVYQESNNQRRRIMADYTIRPNNMIGFKLGHYDHNLPLIIDPVISYLSRFGGYNIRDVRATTIDRQGNIYVVATVITTQEQLPRYPITQDSYQSLPGGDDDIAITKLSADGRQLIYSTYLGGVNRDEASAIAVDDQGNAYITGYTYSPNFPTTINAFQPYWQNSIAAAFVAKLDPYGRELIYSTLLTGIDELGDDGLAQQAGEEGRAITVDSAGQAYIAGYTYSPTFPITAQAAQQRLSKSDCGRFLCPDLFITKLNANGSGLIYSTYLGGNRNEMPSSIAVDNNENLYIAGNTASPNFPATSNAFQRDNHGDEYQHTTGDGFVVKLDHTGSELIYSTLLGGRDADQISDMAIDDRGQAHVTGITESPDFPTTPRAFKSRWVTAINSAFATKLSSNGAELIYSTLLAESERSPRLGLDAAGNAYVAGSTRSIYYPVTADAFQYLIGNPSNTGADFYITKLNPKGNRLLHSTYLGGEEFDLLNDLAVDERGNLFLVGSLSARYPVTKDAYQDVGGIAITKLNFSPVIDQVSASGNKLIITGSGFDERAQILLNGKQIPTINDKKAISTRLIAKGIGKKLLPGRTMTIQIVNLNGSISALTNFTP